LSGRRLGILSVERFGSRVEATPPAGEDLSHRKFGPPFGAIIGTILGIIAWLLFILLYALYWSKNYSLFQNAIVTIASFLIVGLLIGLMWIVWGFRAGWGRRMNWDGKS
jgi:H+/Cl- antiporter ClcA